MTNSQLFHIAQTRVKKMLWKIFSKQGTKKESFSTTKKKDEEEKFEDDSKISSKSLIITHNNAMIIAICVYKSQHHKLCKKYTQ